MPEDETGLLVSAAHSHVLAFDNVSRVSGQMSDALCHIATGGGLSNRGKFTDADEYLFDAKNPVVLNGIAALATRPDLASRALIVQLSVIPDDKRKTEGEHEAEWASVAPRVLGALVAVLSETLRRLPETRPPKLSRMADFERLIIAASPALGWGANEFAAIYRSNIAESDALAIENDLVAGAMLAAIQEDYLAGLEGAMTRLLEILGAKVSDAAKRSRDWPQNAVALGARIERLKPVLRRHGIEVQKRHSGNRWTSIRPLRIETPSNGA